MRSYEEKKKKRGKKGGVHIFPVSTIAYFPKENIIFVKMRHVSFSKCRNNIFLLRVLPQDECGRKLFTFLFVFFIISDSDSA